MTLQERVLEVIGAKAVTPRMLYDALKGEQAAAVDIAVSALMKAGRVTRELGYLQRVNGASVRSSALEHQPLAQPPARAVTALIAAPDVLKKREREVYELAESGWTRESIAQKLNISRGAVDAYVCTARRKLGIVVKKGRPAAERSPESAPAAAVPLSAAPSREGAEMATVGAGPPAKPRPKEEVKVVPIARGLTLSPTLRARLVELQRQKAEEVQMYCGMLAKSRQELADLEEVLRVTEGEGAA